MTGILETLETLLSIPPAHTLSFNPVYRSWHSHDGQRGRRRHIQNIIEYMVISTLPATPFARGHDTDVIAVW